MKLRRFFKSLINSFLFFINAILWIFNINSVGELATKIQVGKGKKKDLCTECLVYYNISVMVVS